MPSVVVMRMAFAAIVGRNIAATLGFDGTTANVSVRDFVNFSLIGDVLGRFLGHEPEAGEDNNGQDDP